MEPPLPDHFDAEDAGKNWNLWCKGCNKGWALPKDNNHPGNLLKLLEHAYSHKSKTKKSRLA